VHRNPINNFVPHRLNGSLIVANQSAASNDITTKLGNQNKNNESGFHCWLISMRVVCFFWFNNIQRAQCGFNSNKSPHKLIKHIWQKFIDASGLPSGFNGGNVSDVP